MKGYRISVIRHGLTDANEMGIYIGKTDMPLSSKGAADLASKMDEFDYPSVHRVYTSPLLRCRETADILFPETEIVPVDEFRELDLGEFEGKTVEELLKRDDYKAWLKGGKDCRPPKGESLEEMTARTYVGLHNIIMDMMESGLTHCALVTHGGIISNMLAGFGIPKYKPTEINAEPGGGFDILVTAQMWLNSQSFEILGYCPYDRIEEDDEF
ncbi:MAG: histidine phosphatase family protein [Ruminococcus sp.]|nr:histidine phosphatase family protein [Ruminococcus sp.]